MKSPQEKIDFIIEYGIDYLNEWENQFIDSMQVVLSQKKETTLKQWQCLTKIFHNIEDKIG
jgi:hypothetical protein